MAPAIVCMYLPEQVLPTSWSLQSRTWLPLSVCLQTNKWRTILNFDLKTALIWALQIGWYYTSQIGRIFVVLINFVKSSKNVSKDLVSLCVAFVHCIYCYYLMCIGVHSVVEKINWKISLPKQTEHKHFSNLPSYLLPPTREGELVLQQYLD